MPERSEGEPVDKREYYCPTQEASHCKRWGRVTSVDVVRHRRCRRMGGLLSPRVHPSGITRGYAWCVPAEDGGWTRNMAVRYGYNKGVDWRNKDILGYALLHLHFFSKNGKDFLCSFSAIRLWEGGLICTDQRIYWKWFSLNFSIRRGKNIVLHPNMRWSNVCFVAELLKNGGGFVLLWFF